MDLTDGLVVASAATGTTALLGGFGRAYTRRLVFRMGSLMSIAVGAMLIAAACLLTGSAYTSAQIVMGVVFLILMELVFFEHEAGIPKEATAIGMGVITTLILITVPEGRDAFSHEQSHNESVIYRVLLFILPAMMIVRKMEHHKLADLVRADLVRRRLRDRGQFVYIVIMCSAMTPFIDNLTTSIILGGLVMVFFTGRNQLVMLATIVMVTNIAGVILPTGDVPVLQAFNQSKFTVGELLKYELFPTVVMLGSASYLMMRKLVPDSGDKPYEKVVVSGHDKLIIAICFAVFFLPFLIARIPILREYSYFGLWLGLCGVWAFDNYVDTRAGLEDRPELEYVTNGDEGQGELQDQALVRHTGGTVHSELTKTEVDHMQHVSVPVLAFFAGLLQSVENLRMIGILNSISNLIFGEAPSEMRIRIGAIILGVSSALIDNVAQMQLALGLVPTNDPRLWTFITFCVCVGGILFIVGTASGVYISTLNKKLTFREYLSLIGVPYLISITLGIAAHFVQPWYYM